MKVIFQTKKISFEAELNNSEASKKLIENLPINSDVNTWGDEIYFDTGITAPSDGKTMDTNIGDIGYWPQGKCLCVFFGPTPASEGFKPVPASHVVIVGKTTASPDILKTIKDGEKITVTEG